MANMSAGLVEEEANWDLALLGQDVVARRGVLLKAATPKVRHENDGVEVAEALLAALLKSVFVCGLFLLPILSVEIGNAWGDSSLEAGSQVLQGAKGCSRWRQRGSHITKSRSLRGCKGQDLSCGRTPTMGSGRCRLQACPTARPLKSRNCQLRDVLGNLTQPSMPSGRGSRIHNVDILAFCHDGRTVPCGS